jgi:uncharacterized YigZ family protein
VDSFLTINQTYQAEIKVKGSKFIGFAIPAASFEEAEASLAEIRKRYYDATHHCYAICLDKDTFRYSDDGEPNGTAGKPMFDVVHGHNLEQIVVVSVRYFGGTKLGTGGLVKAYSDSITAVLETVETVEVILRTAVEVSHSYDQTSLVMHHISNYDIVIEESVYSDNVLLKLAIRNSEVETFVRTLFDASNGQVLAKVIPILS